MVHARTVRCAPPLSQPRCEVSQRTPALRHDVVHLLALQPWEDQNGLGLMSVLRAECFCAWCSMPVLGWATQERTCLDKRAQGHFAQPGRDLAGLCPQPAALPHLLLGLLLRALERLQAPAGAAVAHACRAHCPCCRRLLSLGRLPSAAVPEVRVELTFLEWKVRAATSIDLQRTRGAASNHGMWTGLARPE